MKNFETEEEFYAWVEQATNVEFFEMLFETMDRFSANNALSPEQKAIFLKKAKELDDNPLEDFYMENIIDELIEKCAESGYPLDDEDGDFMKGNVSASKYAKRKSIRIRRRTRQRCIQRGR